MTRLYMLVIVIVVARFGWKHRRWVWRALIFGVAVEYVRRRLAPRGDDPYPRGRGPGYPAEQDGAPGDFPPERFEDA